MKSFEGMQGSEVEAQTGDRAGIQHETKSYYNETLDQAIDGLKSKGYYRVVDTINRLDNNAKATKEKLAQVLNSDAGYDWRIFDSLTKSAEREAMVNTIIVAWAEEVELSVDDAAVRNADKALVEKIEDL